METEDSKRTVRRFYEAGLNLADLAAVEEVIAPEFEDHSYSLRGVAAVQQFILDSRSRFPELEFTIEEMIAEGQVVAVRWVGQGTHQSGRTARWTGMGFYHVRDGKITDHWANVDQLSLRQQLGL